MSESYTIPEGAVEVIYTHDDLLHATGVPDEPGTGHFTEVIVFADGTRATNIGISKVDLATRPGVFIGAGWQAYKDEHDAFHWTAPGQSDPLSSDEEAHLATLVDTLLVVTERQVLLLSMSNAMFIAARVGEQAWNEALQAGGIRNGVDVNDGGARYGVNLGNGFAVIGFNAPVPIAAIEERFQVLHFATEPPRHSGQAEAA